MCVLKRCNKHPAELSSSLSLSLHLCHHLPLFSTYHSLTTWCFPLSLKLCLKLHLQVVRAWANFCSVFSISFFLVSHIVIRLNVCLWVCVVSRFRSQLTLFPLANTRALSRSRSGDVHQKLTDSRRYKTCVSHNLIVNIVFGKSPSMGDARLWNSWNKNKRKELNFWGYSGIKALGLPPSKLICSKVRTCIRRKPSTTKGARERIDWPKHPKG